MNSNEMRKNLESDIQNLNGGGRNMGNSFH